MNSKPPPGLALGVTGFSTQSDIGPTRTDDDGFDNFLGGDSGIFTLSAEEYTDEDKEADEIWDSIDIRMQSRRKEPKVARVKEDIETFRKFNPKITEQVAGLKRKLHDLTQQDWESIPDSGHYSFKNKKKGCVLALNPTNKDVADPQGYLTDLKIMKISSDAEISDIRKARLLLKSVTHTNPKHPPGWIAAARLEEVVGEIQAARKLIEKGCEECANNEDVWLEACRLAPPDEAKGVIARGVKAIPGSVNLWLQAARLEHDDGNKAKVLRKALEHLPTSVRLIKFDLDPYIVAAVAKLFWHDGKLDEARTWLNRAVTASPDIGDFWALYYKFELQYGSEDNQKDVLKRCIAAEPKHGEKWQAISKAVENFHQPTEVILKKAVIHLEESSG